MSLEERIKFINHMQDFVQEGYQSVGKILGSLGWNESEFKFSISENLKCPYEEGHYIPEEKFDKHLEVCCLKKEGYEKNEKLLPPASGNGKFAIKIDAEIRKKVLSAAFNADPTLKLGVENILEDERPIPKSVDRCLSEFTVDERRVLYDFAVCYTSRPDSAKNDQLEQLYQNIGITSGEPSKTSKTLEEMMIELRDAKRRRASYKGKKVKAKSRSYTQTLKNLIETQMDILKELKGDESSIEKSEALETAVETSAVNEFSSQERPKQLYEKQYMSYDRWSYLGDWVARENKNNYERDRRKTSETYESKPSRHSSYRDKKCNDYSDSHKRSRDNFRDSEKDRSRSYSQRRSVSPNNGGKFRGDNYWSYSSSSSSKNYDRNKTNHKSEKETFPSLSDSACSVEHNQDSINRHEQSHDNKNSINKHEKIDDKARKRKHKSLSRSRSRSRSHSHSRSKHKKKHKSEREDKRKDARYNSHSDDSDNKFNRHSRESSSECKYRSSHKKKKKKKSSRGER